MFQPFPLPWGTGWLNLWGGGRAALLKYLIVFASLRFRADVFFRYLYVLKGLLRWGKPLSGSKKRAVADGSVPVGAARFL